MFFQRRHPNGQQVYEKMLKIPSHLGNAIKTTMRYHLTPVRMIFNKKKQEICWQRHGERGTLAHCWWEYTLLQPFWKTVWQFLKKLKIELPFDPAVPLLGIYLKELKSVSWRDSRIAPPTQWQWDGTILPSSLVAAFVQAIYREAFWRSWPFCSPVPLWWFQVT